MLTLKRPDSVLRRWTEDPIRGEVRSTLVQELLQRDDVHPLRPPAQHSLPESGNELPHRRKDLLPWSRRLWVGTSRDESPVEVPEGLRPRDSINGDPCMFLEPSECHLGRRPEIAIYSTSRISQLVEPALKILDGLALRSP